MMDIAFRIAVFPFFLLLAVWINSLAFAQGPDSLIHLTAKKIALYVQTKDLSKKINRVEVYNILSSIPQELLAKVLSQMPQSTVASLWRVTNHSPKTFSLSNGLKEYWQDKVYSPTFRPSPLKDFSGFRNSFQEMKYVTTYFPHVSLNKASITLDNPQAQLLGNSPTIQSLDLSNEPRNYIFTITGLVKLINSIRANQVISSLTLSLLDLSDPEILNSLANMIRSNQSLKSIQIKKSHIPYLSAVALSQSLKENHNLIHLSINSDSQLDEESATEFIQALHLHPSLQSIELSITRQTGNAIIALSKVLQENQNIRSIRLLNYSFQPNDMTTLGQGISQNQSLISLKLQSANLDDTKIPLLADAIRLHPKLTELYLDSNLIGAIGAQTLVNAVSEKDRVQVMSLRNNQIKTAGGSVFASLLSTTQSLRYLNLSANQLNKDAALLLANALSKNTTLQYFGFSANNPESEGGIAFANSLKENSNLQTLDFGLNHIGDRASEEFAKAIRVNRTLTTLLFSTNQAGPKGAQAFANALKFNSTLKILDFSLNRLGESSANIFARALATNHTLTQLNFSSNGLYHEGIVLPPNLQAIHSQWSEINDQPFLKDSLWSQF